MKQALTITEQQIEDFNLDMQGLTPTSGLTEVWSNENHNACGAVVQGAFFNTSNGLVAVAYDGFGFVQEWYDDSFTAQEVEAEIKEIHAAHQEVAA